MDNDEMAEVIEPHNGWASSAAQHLCAEADRSAAVRLLADAFARFEAQALATQAADLAKVTAERDWWIGAAKAMAEREAEYRKMHDLHGDGAPVSGRAWDLMRRQGDRIRAHLLQETDA